MTFYRWLQVAGVLFIAATFALVFAPYVGCLVAGVILLGYGVLFEDW